MMNSKKITKTIILRRLDQQPNRKRKIQLNKNNDSETDEYSSIKREQFDYENTDDDYAEEHSVGEEYLDDSLDPLGGTDSEILSKGLGNWARSNQMPPSAFSDLLGVLKKSGLDVPDHYSPKEKKRNLTNITPLLSSMHNQMIELRQQNSSILNKIKTLEQQVIACKATLDNYVVQSRPEPSKPFTSIKSRLSFQLPVKTIADLEILEERLDNSSFFEDFKDCVRTIMGTLCSRDLADFLHKIIGDPVLNQMNWPGLKNKISFEKKHLLCQAIFEAVKDEAFGYNEFEDQIRKAIKKSHGRTNSNNCRIRRKTEFERSNNILSNFEN